MNHLDADGGAIGEEPFLPLVAERAEGLELLGSPGGQPHAGLAGLQGKPGLPGQHPEALAVERLLPGLALPPFGEEDPGQGHARRQHQESGNDPTQQERPSGGGGGSHLSKEDTKRGLPGFPGSAPASYPQTGGSAEPSQDDAAPVRLRRGPCPPPSRSVRMAAMRLVKIAHRQRQPHGGGGALQRRPRARAGAGDGGGGGDGRVFLGAGGRRLSAGGPGPVAGVPRGPAAELERFARETADLPTVFVVGLAVAVGGQIFNCAAVVHGGEILGFVPKEKLPTYNVFYEARTFSRGGPGWRSTPTACRSATTSSPSTSARGGRGLRGRLVAGRPDAAALLLGRGDRRQRLLLAVPRGRRSDAPRDARHARGRQPGDAGLRQRGRRPGRPDLRRRRLRLPERPAGARGAALPGGLVVLRGRSRPHRRGRGARHTTWRTDCEAFQRAGDRGAGDPERRRRSRPMPRRACPTRRRPWQLLPARPPTCPPARRARRCSTTSSRRWPSACATTTRRPAPSARSASPSRAAATRCSPCWSPGGRRSVLNGAEWPSRPTRADSRGAAGGRSGATDPGVLHAHPLLGRGDAQRRRHALPRAWASRCAWCRSTRPSSARSRPRGRCSAASEPDGDHAPERPGAPAGRACGTGPTPPARCSCRPAT